MYKYFISFNCQTSSGSGFGNAIIEANVRITDFDTFDEMQRWINEIQNKIANTNGTIKNVIILNFQALN